MRGGRVAAVLVMLLSACASAPVIVDLEKDKALIEQRLGTMDTVLAKARKACALHRRTPKGPLSERCLDESCFTKQYLFACMASR